MLSTTTLGTVIDNVNSVWYDYITVFLTHYWPFLVGAMVVVGVVALGIRFLVHLFKH